MPDLKVGPTLATIRVPDLKVGPTLATIRLPDLKVGPTPATIRMPATIRVPDQVGPAPSQFVGPTFRSGVNGSTFMDDARTVKVEIHGQEYPIRSGLDPGYIGELANYVDAKMRLASRETVTGDTLKIAVLAALNIADECFRLQAEDRQRRDSLTTRAEELERMLDLALGLDPQATGSLPMGDGQLSPAAGSLLR